MYNSASLQDMMHVANSCYGYENKNKRKDFISNIGSEESISCINCEHLKHNKCQKNLYDKVLSSLDQT
ncbi:hypothetical protein ACOAKC_12905 [Hathewaya histolytica]|uniref:hypothetical protein n=1 Tax=Hathewaya histolytica TaxID=1498 RepID=UPI003B674644